MPPPPPGQPEPTPVSWNQSPAREGSDAQNTAGQPAFGLTKGNVTQKDIFTFAKWILAVAAGVYAIMIVLRVVNFKVLDKEAMKDVWDKTTVFLNSIITLVLGLYFGAKKEDARKDG